VNKGVLIKNYAAYWQSRQKQPDTLPPPKKDYEQAENTDNKLKKLASK
jgi:hypothetical protein